MKLKTGTVSFVLVACLSFADINMGCKPASGPLVDAEAGVAALEAGIPIATGVCSLVEGIDTTGTIRSICATVEEVAQVIAFILTLRSATDAGAPTCSTVPAAKTGPESSSMLATLCTTSAERAKAVLYLVKIREARLIRDGGK
jgi:hypothetical protein